MKKSILITSLFLMSASAFGQQQAQAQTPVAPTSSQPVADEQGLSPQDLADLKLEKEELRLVEARLERKTLKLRDPKITAEEKTRVQKEIADDRSTIASLKNSIHEVKEYAGNTEPQKTTAAKTLQIISSIQPYFAGGLSRYMSTEMLKDCAKLYTMDYSKLSPDELTLRNQCRPVTSAPSFFSDQTAGNETPPVSGTATPPSDANRTPAIVVDSSSAIGASAKPQ